MDLNIMMHNIDTINQQQIIQMFGKIGLEEIFMEIQFAVIFLQLEHQIW